jgi:Pyridoxamine 5'-phosphate oxidase
MCGFHSADRIAATASSLCVMFESGNIAKFMSKAVETITPELADWISSQKIFFVATSPLAANGHVNCSPKGGNCFRVFGPRSVGYLDYTGSGAETIAHLKDNGRIVIMFCGFEGPPQIVRLHGRGEVVEPAHPEFAVLTSAFPSHAGARAIIRVAVARVSTSCGHAVPFFEYRAPRDLLDKWSDAKGPEGMREYRHQKNRTSIDGLPALDVR